ncbi:hypothetical protein LCGC14_1994390, partial [marine sediment metagenome]
LLVYLASDDTTEATVPATVTIAAGQTSAAFNIEIENDSQVDGTQIVTVTARVENWTDGVGTVEVVDNDNWIKLLVPETVNEGMGLLLGAGTVSIGGTSPVDLTVLLVSGDPSELIVLPSLIIPAGERSVAFSLIVPDDTEYDGVQTVSIEMHASDLAEPVTAEDVQTVLRAWARYQRSHGATPQQMVGAAIFSKVVT